MNQLWSCWRVAGVAVAARDQLSAEGDGEPPQSGDQPGLRASAQVRDG